MDIFPPNVMVWGALALLFLVIEVLTHGFFFMFFAIGAAIAAGVALLTPSLGVQAGLFVAVSLLTCIFVRPILKRALNLSDKPRVLSNVDALPGEPVLALEGVTRHQGRVKVVHTGEVWSAYMDDSVTSESLSEGQEGVVVKVDGAKLAIRPKI